MRGSLSIVLTGLVALAAAGPIPESHVVHERRGISHASSRWVKRDRVQKDAILPIRVGLKQNNLQKGHEWLMDVSHPDSPNYGKHWTSEDVIAAFQPAEDTVKAVMDWLVNVGGISDHRITHSDNKGWLAFDATNEEAENLLHTKFHEFEHSSSGSSKVACDEYHVPKSIQSHIDYITPGVKGAKLRSRRLSKPKPKPKRSFVKNTGISGKPFEWVPPKQKPAPFMPQNDTELATCDVAITPACIRALYHIDAQSPHAKVNPNNSLGIFEEGDFYSQEDLNLFFANFTPYIPAGTHPIPNFVDGAQAPVPVADAGGESDLDFQLAYPIIYPQTTTLYQVDDIFYSNSPNNTATGIFNTFFDALDGSYCTYSAFGETGNDPTLDPVYPDPNAGGYKGKLQCGVYKPTNVISISYGEQEQDLPAYYQERQCNEFLKLGLQGTSIFVASGDTGVGGIPGDGSANGCLGPNATIFSPTQPNSCPWLTNVGATKVYPGRTVFEPESAVVDLPGHPYHSAFSSGGGFSNIFSVPDYQKAAVATYFADHNPPYPYYTNGQYNTTSGGLYNRNGRGIPDVAANGDNIATYIEGKFKLEGGTSASSPIFASIINRIVEARLAAGKGPLGFVNPVLYANPWVLNDITNGTNPGCGTSGFAAVKGWDPVTGLGTPNYPRMKELWLSLP
ncbi:hypothetical protein MBLNU459_g6595t1 [Dothideomycetes sp. NU459]